MAKVNLLPWRAERRRERQQAFYVMLGVAFAIALAIGLGAWVYYNGQIDGENARNAYLTDQIKKLDAKIAEIDALDKKKETLLRRKDVIEQLQANRSQMVHLFDELVRTIPDGVRLTSVKQDGNKLTLQGYSQSNARVSAYMRNIEASGWMTNPDLNVIEASSGDKTLPYQFTLALTLTKPGQVLGPDGKPVLGPDGKPLMNPAPGAASGAASPAAVGAPPSAAASPAASSPAASPASGASSKGGAKP
ncbi:MAG: PilN domain-containing protein [Proteobacteria bacterium]|nr:PilN domain-containing protein [Pseudomonadota bacterium]MBS0462201.1 PilN domain-containing protein [Pseudomonadota bacterium]MBS0463642.1 PilN domain-containing protein [Pseudomonadota bacterium]